MRNHQVTLLLIISFMFFSTLAPVALADIVNFDFINSSCRPGEQWVSCEYDWSNPILLTGDNCKKLEMDPHYRFLSSDEHSLGGTKAYCYKNLSSAEYYPAYFKNLNGFISKVVAPTVFLTIILELPVFFAFGLRTKKLLSSVIFVNFISVPLINVTLFLLPFGGVVVFLLAELFVIFFESGTLVAFNKNVTLLRGFLLSLGANLLSASVGSMITSWMLG